MTPGDRGKGLAEEWGATALRAIELNLRVVGYRTVAAKELAACAARGWAKLSRKEKLRFMRRQCNNLEQGLSSWLELCAEVTTAAEKGGE